MAFFNRIARKIITKSMQAQFATFLNDLENEMKENITNRASRRKNGDSIYKLLGNVEMVEVLKTTFASETSLNGDRQYEHLLYALAYFYNTRYINNDLFFETILKPYIECSKKTGFNTKFTNYFDHDIKPKMDTIFELNNYIASIAYTYKKISPSFDDKEFINTIVPRELIMQAEGIINAIESRKSKLKYEKSISKRKEKYAEELNKQEIVFMPKETKTHQVQSKLDELYKNGELDNLFNEIKDINELNGLHITKTELNDLKRNYSIYRIKKIIGIELFNNLQICINNSNDAKLEFDKLIKQFNNMKHSEIKDTVIRIINPKLTSNAMVSNYIIFPSDEFINRDLTQLKGFTSNTKFIDLKDISNKEIVISNNRACIAYLNDTMVCLFNLNIHDENRKVLGENTNILLILGIGNIDDVINESIDFVYKNYMLVNEIINIFSNPFTPTTLNKAKELIESSKNTIEKSKNKETDNTKKKKM